MAQVMVTGGNGFVAGWCIAQVLEPGHEVVATVRTPAKAEAVRAAVDAAPGDTALRSVLVDLLDDEGWMIAMAGCDTVLHVASPLAGDESDPDSYRPATETIVASGPSVLALTAAGA